MGRAGGDSPDVLLRADDWSSVSGPLNQILVPTEWMRLMPAEPVLSSENAGWGKLSAFRVKNPLRSQLHLPAAGGHFISAHLFNPCQISARWNGTPRRSRSIPGDTIIMSAHQENFWEWTGEIDELQMFLDPTLFADSAAEITDRPVRLVEGIGIRDGFIAAIAAQLVEELSNPGACSRLFGDSVAHALAAQLLRRHSTIVSTAALERVDIPSHKVRAAIEFILSRLGENISIDAIAAAVHMSSFRFARGFKKATGQSPHRFVIEKRIELAKHLLRTTDQKLADIARAAGFATQSHFTTAFRRHSHATPAAYRHAMKPAGK